MKNTVIPLAIFLPTLLLHQTAQSEVKNDLETVIVSATRIALNVGDAPNNISLLQTEQLATTQAVHIQQALSQIPGVSLQRGDGQESLPGIRSAVLTGAGACGNVLIMEEGLPVRGPAFCNVNELFDTHFEQAGQIEVTRGPGTSFYGSNALTGSVNVSLPVKGADVLALELGEESYRRAKGAFSYGGDSGGGRVYLTLTDTSSFRADAGYSQQKLSLRHQQKWGDWQVHAGVSATRLDQETAGFITGLDSYRDQALARLNPDPEAFRLSKSLRSWARFSRTLANSNTLQITPYVRATDMDFRLHFLPGDPLEQNQQLGVGWQSSLRGNTGEALSWALGFDADFSDGELQQTQDQPTRGSAFLRATIPTGTHYDYQVNARQLGGFAHLEWRPTNLFSLIAGLRAEQLDYDYDNRGLDGRTRDDGTDCGFGGCRYSRPADRYDSFSDLSPKLELRYSINQATTLHASVASSFRAPQATELYRLQRRQQVADLDSVQADNVEFGISHRTESTQISAALYQLKQKNVIIRDSDFFNVDGNRIDSQGFELSIHKALGQRFSWRLAGALAKHEYGSDRFSGQVNINGNEVDTAPTSLLNMALNWRINDALSTELELQHVGAYYLEPENQREYPGHEVLNLRASYQVNPRLTASMRVINVADKRYAERADFTGFTNERYFPGAPRTLFLGLRYSFVD